MTAERSTAEDDLAFVRRLTALDQGPAWRRAFGRMYALWGFAFGVPLLFEWARWAGYLELPRDFWLWCALAVTLLMTGLGVYFARRDGPVVGVQPRALNAVFAGAGLANVVMLATLLATAFHIGDFRILMLHASIVFAFQGAAWYVVWALRKQLWAGLLAAGWSVTAIALGVTLATPNFLLIAALGLLLLMGAPGVLMWRAPVPE
ncbi:hypothetical protein ACFODL_15985 [Phenylobacterium terrae]|uniref:Uncharacterized protein n=1 Tax=Phenylobacterium terrae TaxID=2665495 RepID=A0ABW4N6W3_9CAUL